MRYSVVYIIFCNSRLLAQGLDELEAICRIDNAFCVTARLGGEQNCKLSVRSWWWEWLEPVVDGEKL